MKLTKENLQFIDTYLKNNQVIYIDIRYEMIDHIATAVEHKMKEERLDFYEAFKNYMLLNKTALLKNSKKSTSFSWLEIGTYLKYLISPILIAIGFLLVLTLKVVDISSYFSRSFTLGNLVFLLFITIVLFQIVYVNLYLKKKYYGIEKTSQILLILYLILPISNETNVGVSIFFLFLLFGYMVYFMSEISKFNKHKFNYL